MNFIEQISKKATQIVANAQTVTLASIDENGYPRPVILSKLGVIGNAIYVSTGSSSAKTAHFIANPKAGMSIVEGGNSIVYTGEISIETDQTIKQSLWQDWMSEHFLLGVNDPEYCVLKFTPLSNTYWIDKVFIKNNIIMNLYCQSCGMPMQTADQFSTEADGSENHEYCCYCYQNGAFTNDCTMEQMIEHCAQFTEQFNKDTNAHFSKEEAIAAMKSFFPHLKRWAK